MGHPPFIPYRRTLKARAQSLRRDPTPAERKLWFEFLRDLPVRFTREKPLGHYIEVDGDSHFTDRGAGHDASRTAALEGWGIRVLRVTNLEVMDQFEGVCQRIAKALEKT